MSTSSVVSKMPKALRDQLKDSYLYDGCFTNERRTVVKDSHAMLVEAGIVRMIRDRQELLLGKGVHLDYGLDETTTVPLLRDIEVLRLFITLLKEDSK